MSLRNTNKPIGVDMPGSALKHRPKPAHPLNDIERLAELGRIVGPLVKELRHPVGNLLAAANMLGEEISPNDPSSGFVRLVHRETDRLQQTLEDLAMLAAPSRPIMQNVDMISMFRGVVSDIERAAMRQGIRVNVEWPEMSLRVNADLEALRAVLTKIPLQAMEAMPYGGMLTIIADTVTHRTKSFARVRFSDSGPAVPEGTLSHMFDPFFVAEGRHPGMALALCKAVIERMDGRVFVHGGGQVGLTVELQLPLL